MVDRTVLVTGVGGNVGQGILRNIRSLDMPIKLIGTNTVAFTAGNHFCDEVFTVKPAYEQGYLEQMAAIVKRAKVDLIIPSTDYEVFHLSKGRASLGCQVAVSGSQAASVYLDKYKSFQHHLTHGIPFAQSVLPSEYKGQFNRCIAKPREGRGSRGLVIDPVDFSVFDDSAYVIQEFHAGCEITTAFYVTQNAQLHGFITMSRKLDHGTTMECEVVTAYDDILLPMLQKMVNSLDIRGGANLQSIVLEDGRIVPFEVNCRISGTNSIRSQFGFSDVLYTLQEYLYSTKPDRPDIRAGRAVRVLMDIIYPDKNDTKNSYIF